MVDTMEYVLVACLADEWVACWAVVWAEQMDAVRVA